MTTVYRHNGDVLKEGDLVAKSSNCCCEDCCPYPCDSLLLCFSSDDCPCANGCCIQLDWVEVDSCWVGQGACGNSCALETTEWKLCCCNNNEAAEKPCQQYCLSYLDTNACVLLTDPLFPTNTCECDPFTLVFFPIDITGIGCCNNMTGGGRLVGTITCLPAAMESSTPKTKEAISLLPLLPDDVFKWLTT